MAKVDATVDGKVAASYKVQGYPTLFFFHKGEKIDYNGQRSKDILINWLLKKTRDPLVPIDQAGYEKLQTEDKVSIVFHGDASSTQGQLVSKIAVADDYNSKKLIIQLITLPKSEKLKAVLKSSDHSIQSLLMKVLMRDWPLGSRQTKDQLLFHSMTEPSVICSVMPNQEFACSTRKDQMFCWKPSLKAPRLPRLLENNSSSPTLM